MVAGRKATAEVRPGIARPFWRERGFWLKYSAFYGLVALVVVSAFVSPYFLTLDNILNIFRQWSMIAVIAVGMTFVIIARGIDLSGGAVLALGAVLGALLFPKVGTGLMVAAVLGVGLLCGAVNGLLVSRAGIAPFITTLGMMTIARGLALIASEGRTVVATLPESFQWWFGTGSLLGVPTPVWWVALVSGGAIAVLRFTPYGRRVALVGDNEAAAFAAGIKVKWVTFSVYAVHGLLAGLAGLVFLGRLGVGEPTAGALYELSAIAAVVIGGTPFTGGQGGVGFTLLGVLILGFTYNILNLLGVSPYAQDVARGVIIIAAVYLSVKRAR